MKSDKQIISDFRAKTWYSINVRTVNGCNIQIDNRSANRYRSNGVKLKMSKEEYYSWCNKRKSKILKMHHAGKRPSIDRIDDNGDYAIDNLRIISFKKKLRVRFKKRKTYNA